MYKINIITKQTILRDLMEYEFKQGMKYLWKIPQVDQKKVNQAVNDFHLSRPVAQALVARGFETKSEIEDFLFVSKDKE